MFGFSRISRMIDSCRLSAFAMSSTSVLFSSSMKCTTLFSLYVFLDVLVLRLLVVLQDINKRPSFLKHLLTVRLIILEAFCLFIQG